MTSKTVAELSRPGRAALHYVTKYGWYIFPLAPRSKTPFKGSSGLHDGTTDPDQIRRWWHKHPTANVALACGQQSGVVVVDVDTKSGGLGSWAELLDIHGPLDTLEVLTGSGGGHIYLQAPEIPLKSTSGVIAPGIDTRADGGYVVLPPSVHPCGEPYEWASRVPPTPIPRWLLDVWPQAEITKRRSQFRAHSGRPMAGDMQVRVRDLCAGQWGLKLQSDGRYAGRCPFPHVTGPCDCRQGFFISPITGQWHCFCSDHPRASGDRPATGWYPERRNSANHRSRFLPVVEVSSR